MSRLGIALVGCGGMARNVHLPSIALLRDELELVAVCDRDQPAADAMAGKYGCRAYTCLSRLLGEERTLDIVSVTVHAQHHHTVAVEALNAGKHVIVEKPIAITMPCAQSMLDVAKKNNVMIEVTENYFRMPMDAFINTVAHSSLLGAMRTVQVVDPVNGMSLDIGVHRYSQLREAAGGWPTALTALSRLTGIPQGWRSKRSNEREHGDTRGAEWGVAMIEFDNGVLGKGEHFPLGKDKLAWPSDLRQIVCDDGGIADDLWPNVWPWAERGQLHIKRWAGHEGHVSLPFRRIEEMAGGRAFASRVEMVDHPEIAYVNPVLEIIRRGSFDFVGDEAGHGRTTWPDWFVAELTAYATFAQAARGEIPQQYSGAKGANDLELCIATYESERLGTRVTLPLEGITPHEERVHKEFEERYGKAIL